MTRFTFRLQPLMKLREAERDRRREELAEAYRTDQVLAGRQEAILQEMEETRMASRRQAQPGSIHVDGLLNSHRYELLLTTQHRQLTAQRQKVSVEIERRRQVLVEADQDLRILEKLRARHEAEFRSAEEKQNFAQMDEIALRRQQATRGGSR